jgi:hypothetical protein
LRRCIRSVWCNAASCNGCRRYGNVFIFQVIDSSSSIVSEWVTDKLYRPFYFCYHITNHRFNNFAISE